MYEPRRLCRCFFLSEVVLLSGCGGWREVVFFGPTKTIDSRCVCVFFKKGAPAAGLLNPQVRAQRPPSPIRPLFSWWPVAVAVALVLLCLFVGVFHAVNRRFEALAGRVAMLELRADSGQLALALVGRGEGVV